MNVEENYPIGTPGQKWAEKENTQWFEAQTIKRSYQEEVVEKIIALNADFDIQQYGSLTLDETRYPLLLKQKTGIPVKKRYSLQVAFMDMKPVAFKEHCVLLKPKRMNMLSILIL